MQEDIKRIFLLSDDKGDMRISFNQRPSRTEEQCITEFANCTEIEEREDAIQRIGARLNAHADELIKQLREIERRTWMYVAASLLVGALITFCVMRAL